tara:strand:- start:682 stop:1071 length:390 start_codon:yes stop_codon:yes gene_type:complete
MKSIKDEKNYILPRRELIFEINHATKSTPTKHNVREEVSKTIKCNKELVIIKKVDTHYGSTVSHAKVYVYDNKDEMKILEKIREEPKKEEAPATESKPVEEKPAEETVEKKIEEKQDGKESKAEEQSPK